MVVGSGGREHALARSLHRAPSVNAVLCAPGNPGTAAFAENVPTGDIDGWVRVARDAAVDLVVVGPEQPLVDGLADALAAVGIACFGPSRDAARLEGSKAHTKRCCARWAIPTARAEIVTDLEAGLSALDAFDDVPVVKASGLAAGKGVIVPADRAGAEAALRAMFVERRFGAAADEVVVEERLHGREVSLLALCDGTDAIALPLARDHKRLGAGDTGPNTGGMGAVAPAALVDPGLDAAFVDAALDRFVRPALAGLRSEGTPYVGVLYAGLMVDDAGAVTLLEYNCRMGDPETQAVLPLLDDTVDLGEVFASAAGGGGLGGVEIAAPTSAAVTVVLAAHGYPVDPRRGDPIVGVDAAVAAGCEVFHAGTAVDADGRLVTAGGRVLAVTAVADDLVTATDRARAGAEAIDFAGAQWRRDIGAAVAP